MSMPAFRRPSRWLALAVSAAGFCLLVACTGPALSRDSASSGTSTSTAQVSPTVRRTPDYALMKRQLQQRLASADLSLSAVRTVLVSVDGHTVLSYYADRQPSDYAHVWSVTKSVMSILVGIAIDEGRLRLDETLAELLPAHADAMTREIRSVTLRQLLTMTAGLQSRPSFDTSAKDPVAEVVGEATVAEPGAAFGYSNASAHLVGAVLRHAIDRPILDYAREKLFDPLGIDTRPAWQGWDVKAGLDKPGFAWGTDREGTNSGCCLLKLTAPDMLKIGQLYLNQGRWQGHQLVSAQWVTESTTNQLTTGQTTTEGPYGYLWWVGEIESHPYFAAVGSYGQNIIVVPDSRIVLVTVSDESGLDLPSEEFENTITDVIIKPILSA